ncbi:LysR family transcriptional regulator [Pseudomonas sessilinigenes]|uniref:LysR family transcriptional regulator n=1 Tax=Pseudomonas sessilinigenes TaxID=658629 RepID=A0ABX8N084_9PSED|nr:LysR family transcriptional regulator [Pseudomonas sessilinigenes]AZC24395.1 Transcriptional regulator, LysR family [Pseudomonas sessilinigenes]QXH43336.1 LysR family transcriptional regulator [Pseudomonas sessilinigenes]
MDRWTQIELFVQVAELGNLSRAAEKVGLSNAAASRYLSGLEERLGARLVERTTRRMWLTEAGRSYHQCCSALLAEMAEADAAVNSAATSPSGVLRVTSSVSFAMNHLAPALPEFRRRFPKLAVQITTANRYPGFIEAGIDVAIRTREYEGDSGITVRRLAQMRRVLAASPAYLAAQGRPKEPAELAHHQMLVYNLANDPYVLHFKGRQQACAVGITPVLDANEGQVIRAAALAGLGILIQPQYIIHDDIVAGRLIPVLSEWELPPLTINIAYQSRRLQPAKVKVFTEFLIERFTKLGLERKWAS